MPQLHFASWRLECAISVTQLKTYGTGDPNAPNCNSETKWHLARNNQKLGPFSGAQLRQMTASDIVQPSDMILEVGQTKWYRASDISSIWAEGVPIDNMDGSVQGSSSPAISTAQTVAPLNSLGPDSELKHQGRSLGETNIVQRNLTVGRRLGLFLRKRPGLLLVGIPLTFALIITLANVGNTNETKIQRCIAGWLDEQKRGSEGHSYWENQRCQASLFAVRSWKSCLTRVRIRLLSSTLGDALSPK